MTNNGDVPSLSWVTDEQGNSFPSLRGGWAETFAEELAAAHFERLEIWPGDWGNFEFLGLLANKVKHLRLVGYFGPLRGLEQLTCLESLMLPLDGVPRDPPDLSKFARLTGFSLHWHKSFATQIGALHNLRGVGVFGYSEVDCRPFGKVQSLDGISLTRGKVQTLDGLEGLSRFTSLHLAYLRELRDMEAIRSMSGLKYLWVENAPKLQTLSPIYDLSGLETLYLYNCGELFDAGWLVQLKSVKKLWIPVPLRARVDWAGVLGLPALELMAIRPLPADVIADEDIRELAAKAKKRVTKLVRGGTKKSPIFEIGFSG